MIVPRFSCDRSIGQFRRALKTHLFCWWLRRFVTFCFMAPCINVLTYLLTFLLAFWMKGESRLRGQTELDHTMR